MEQESVIFRATIVDSTIPPTPDPPAPLVRQNATVDLTMPPPPPPPPPTPVVKTKEVPKELPCPACYEDLPELHPFEHPFERFERQSELAEALPSILLGVGVAYAIGVLTGAVIFSPPSMVCEA